MEEYESKQGILGKFWNSFKNLTHIGAGSKKAHIAISEYRNGKITYEQMIKQIDNYKEGQKQCVDIIADIVSGIAAFGAFSFGTTLGIIASPFTGGASLGLVAAGFAAAGTVGAATKIAIKGIDAASGGRKYDTLGYDLATGGINGVFAPITAGIGGAAGKAVAGRLGVAAIREGGEVVLKESLKGTIRGTIAKTMLTTNVRYIGGTMISRAIALGTDMAVNGAITSGVDSGTRYLAGDRKDKSFGGFIEEVGIGTASGFVMSPIIGGGMRLTGKGVGKLTGSMEHKVKVNCSRAKSAMLNNPEIKDADTEFVKRFAKILKEAKVSLSNVHKIANENLENLNMNVTSVSENISEILVRTQRISSDFSALNKQEQTIIIEILSDIANGRGSTSKIAKLSRQGIKILEKLGNITETANTQFEKNINNILKANAIFTKNAQNGINQLEDSLENLVRIANNGFEEAKNIPKTNAFRQLGALADRLENLSKITKDFPELEILRLAAIKKLCNGNVEDGLQELIQVYTKALNINIELSFQIMLITKSVQRAGLDESCFILQERLQKLISSESFIKMSREQQLQKIMEESNILFAKFAQTYSSNPDLPAEISNIFKQFTSNCSVSRNLAQAQSFADKLYGCGKYTLIKSFGAGTIGETYLARTADGKDVVIKMLKEGVSIEKFRQDRQMFVKYITENFKDPVQQEYRLNLINSMFDAWEKELDFALEANGAKNMARGAKRFSVAQTLEVGSINGRNVSLVMEKAHGLQLDKLLEMIKLYKQNPTEYFTKYANEINEYPALKNPESWIKKLAPAYQRAQNEQILFIGENGTRTIHADPHAGNIFVDFAPQTNNPQIIYIDTGNVIERSAQETLHDITLSLNTMLGNSQGMAEGILDGVILPAGTNKKEMAKKLASMLDERLFKADVNLKNARFVQKTINQIMKELNIIPDTNNSNLLKASLQRLETSGAINTACGTTSNKRNDLKDLLFGIIKAFKASPLKASTDIYDIMTWMYNNDEQAIRTIYQVVK